jgi:hypothetical protein
MTSFQASDSFRDRQRRAAGYDDETGRPCARGQWCGRRTVTIDSGQRITSPALTPRAFCDHDRDLIGRCLDEFPGIYDRLRAELGEPVTTDSFVRVPFGPSVPLRLDVDTVMRMAALMLRTWEVRVRTIADRIPPGEGDGIEAASGTLAKNLDVLLSLQPGWMTRTWPLPAGKPGTTRSPLATCRRCGRLITRSAYSGKWWAADASGITFACTHQPQDTTGQRPASAPIPADLEDQIGDEEIVRTGIDFITVMTSRSGTDAGLEVLHLHYWCRTVLCETPARPEELLGVECKECSLRTLRRADPPWHDGDPVYYSECADCGALMDEDEYRTWTGQLAAYERARRAVPVLGEPSPAA